MKNKSTLFLIVILIVLASLLAYNYFAQPFQNKFINWAEQTGSVDQDTQSQNALPDQDTTISNPVQQTFEQMSAQEKIAQLISFPIMADAGLVLGLLDPDVSEFIASYRPGVITLFGENISLTTAQMLINRVSENYSQSTVRPIFAVDHEGGSVQRLSGTGFSKLPSWQEMCETNETSSLEIFTQSAQELNTVGINVVYAPVLDVSEEGSAILKNRVCSDYDKALDTADEFISSFAKFGIMSVVKHFPGIGNISQDLHLTTDEVEIDIEDALMFQRMLDKYPNIGVMTAHIRLKNKLGGLPCSLSSDCLREFANTYTDSIVFTDALDMNSALLSEAGEKKSLTEVSIQAILAGNNVLVYGKGVSSKELEIVAADLLAQYEQSEEFQTKVDLSVKKLLNLKVEN